MLETDLKYYKSAEVSSATTNGGSISNNEAVSGVPNNIWPHVLKAERDAGSVLWRKVFLKAVTEDSTTFVGADLWNEAPTPADDYIDLFPGTADDTQATVVTTDGYCAALLSSNATSTTSTLIVILASVAQAAYFPDGRVLRVTGKATPSSVTGTEEQHTISGTPVLVGLVLTITLATALTSSYLIGDKVQGVLQHGDITSSTDSLAVTSSAGTYDDTTYPVVANNSGAVTEVITCEFTDASNYIVTGSVSGSLGTGNITTDFTPAHPVSGNDMFTLEFAGFGAGAFVASDTIVFNLVGAYAAAWLRRTVPAGANSLADNVNITYTYGQS